MVYQSVIINLSLMVPHVQLLVKMICDLLVPSSQHLRVAYGVTELGFESSHHPSKEEEECKLITVRGKGYYPHVDWLLCRLVCC